MSKIEKGLQMKDEQEEDGQEKDTVGPSLFPFHFVEATGLAPDEPIPSKPSDWSPDRYAFLSPFLSEISPLLKPEVPQMEGIKCCRSGYLYRGESGPLQLAQWMLACCMNPRGYYLGLSFDGRPPRIWPGIPASSDWSSLGFGLE